MSLENDRNYANKWRIMSAVAMGIFLATVDGSIVNIAMPTLQKALLTDFAMVQWVVLAYLLVVTTLLLGVGRLGDMLGRKALYSAGFVVFTASSLLCGLAPGIEWLIVFRAIQAVGAALMMALGAAIITEAFPEYERGQALGVIGTVVSIGIVTGPVLGGIIIGHFSWHWIFFVNLPVGILGTWMVGRYVPHHRPPGGQRFDFAGAASLFISLTALLLGLTLGQRIGFTDMSIFALLVVWFVFLVAFLLIEIRVPQPMLDLRIFLDGHLIINVITGFATFVSVAGVFLLMPFYLENVLGFDTQKTGMLLSVVPIALGVVAPRAGKLSDRVGTRPLTVAGLGMLLIGFLSASTLEIATSAPGYILRMLPIGIGMGIFQSPNNSAIMGSVPRSQLGVASGLLSITRTLGQTVGVAVMGTIWAGAVLLHAGGDFHDTPTKAPAGIQVEALHHTFQIIAALIGMALILSLWGLHRERRLRRQADTKSG